MAHLRLRNAIITAGIILGIVITKTASTQAISYSFKGNFDSAWFSNWFATNFIIFCFPSYLLIHFIFGLKPQELLLLKRDAISMFLDKQDKLSYLKTIILVSLFTFLWTGANYSYVKSLEFIKPAETVILFSTCSGFIYILSLLLLKEKFYYTKLVALLFAVAGVGVYSKAVHFNATNLLGIVFAIIAALFAAFYKVLFQKIIKPGFIVQVTLILSAVAFFNFCFVWIGIIILHFSKLEVFPTNLKDIPWGLLCARGIAGLLYNFLENYGVANCGALTVTLGSLISIPVIALIDALTKSLDFSTYKIIASFLLIISFLLSIIPFQVLDKYEAYLKRKTPESKPQSSEEIIN